MGDITISEAVAWVLAASTFIFSVAKAWEVISKLFRPNRNTADKLVQHEKLLDNDHQRLKTLELKQAQHDAFQGVMCRVMLAQLNHELSGNDIDHLREARDELNAFLTKR